MGTLSGLNNLRDVDARDKELEMLKNYVCQVLVYVGDMLLSLLTFLGPVLAIEDRKLSEDTHLRCM